MAETRVHAARLETWANDIERSLYERQPVEDDRVEVSDMAALRAGAAALRAQDDGLEIDMLDADRLRLFADRIETYGDRITEWGSPAFVVSRLREIAAHIEAAVKATTVKP